MIDLLESSSCELSLMLNEVFEMRLHTGDRAASNGLVPCQVGARPHGMNSR